MSIPSPLKLRPRSLAWLTVLWLLCTGYNLFKPYHIDDVAYVRVAQWISMHPLHPMQGVLWANERIPLVLHPHLYMYVLAGWGKLFGFEPPSLHLVQALASLGCILFLHRLFSRFAPDLALWGTAIIILGPAFIVEQNLMMDVPLLLTWLIFFGALLGEVESTAQTRRYVIAALSCSAGLLTKYSSAILLPILLISLLWERRSKQMWTLALPIGTLIAWSAFNYYDYGHFHLLVKSDRQHHSLVKFCATWLITVGGLTPLGMVGGFRLVQRRKLEVAWWGLLFLAFAALLALVLGRVVSGLASDRILVAMFVMNSALLLFFTASRTYAAWTNNVLSKKRETRRTILLYLLLWIGGTTAFYIIFAPFIAARHVLLILPPITLILIASWQEKLSRTAKVCSLALTILISSGLAVSDFRFADFQRSEAFNLQKALPGSGAWWTNGHFGWLYYAQKRGFEAFDVKGSDLRQNDSFVVPSGGLEDMTIDPRYFHFLKTDIEPRPLLSVLCTGRPARLYRSDPKYGPWSVSADCSSRFDVYQVVADWPAAERTGSPVQNVVPAPQSSPAARPSSAVRPR